MLLLYEHPLSSYAQKVKIALREKGVTFTVQVPEDLGSGRRGSFAAMNPRMEIPVLIDGDFSASDSSVICAYLDEAYPDRPLLPSNPRDRARARWFEEYADTRLGDVFIWGLFYQKIVHGLVWGEPGDQARVAKTIAEDAPRELDYLENELPEDGFLFGDIGLADISIASFFRNGAYAGFETDAARWPRTAAFVGRTLDHPCIAALLPFEDVQRSAEIKQRRQALLDAGAPLTSETLGLREPRKGMMRL